MSVDGVEICGEVLTSRRQVVCGSSVGVRPSRGLWGVVVQGGVGRIAEEMVAGLVEYGGAIEYKANVREILTEGSDPENMTATGVRLADGRVFRCTPALHAVPSHLRPLPLSLPDRKSVV